MQRADERRADERGFALLLVFLMASIVAIGLYYELPRVALETQRQKEQLLIDRGEQYKRAIQLFYKKTGRYPSEIKELESFQNQRFLRRRYVDPMTGKDEWRLIHIANGVLTDSLLVKPKGKDEKEASTTAGQYVGVQAGLGETLNGPQTGGINNARDRRRPSEGGTAMPGPDGQPYPGQPQGQGGPGFPNLNPDPNAPLPNFPGAQQGAQQGGFPGQFGGQPGVPTGMPTPFNGQPGVQPFPGQIQGQPGAPSPFPTGQPPAQPGGGGGYVGTQAYVGNSGPYVGGGAVAGSNPGNPGAVNYPGQSMPGQMYPGQPGQPGLPVNSQTGGVSPYPTQGTLGTAVPFQQPGIATAPIPGTAADMINRILTTPRPGGMPQNTSSTGAGGMIGGGVAGVASKAEGDGVKVYNERSMYKEWEFTFDPAKVKPPQNPNVVTGTPGGTPVSQMGSMPAQSGMTPVGGGPLNQSTPFGTPPKQP